MNFALQSSSRVNVIRETFIFHVLLPYVYFPFTHWVKFCSGCFRQVFSFGGQKPGCVRQVVILHSNGCIRICLGRLSIVCLRQVVALWRWSFEQYINILKGLLVVFQSRFIYCYYFTINSTLTLETLKLCIMIRQG